MEEETSIHGKKKTKRRAKYARQLAEVSPVLALLKSSTQLKLVAYQFALRQNLVFTS